MRVATAFSRGLAALEFGLRYENIKHEIVLACEWDKYARKQYLHFHGEPTSNFYEDIQELDATTYKDKIDLYCFGSPCQDLSLAGNRKGFLGEKSSLFRHGARVLEEMRPKIFIFENVKGLLSSNGGADYKEVVKTFQDMGYLIASKVLNAKEHGTAQNRERIFIVGFLDVQQYHDFSFEDKIPLTKTLKDYLENDVDEKYYLSDKMVNGFLVHKERHLERGNGFKFEPKKGDDIVAIKSATKQGYEVATENDSINFTHPNSKTRRGRVGVGVAQTLDCACNQGVYEPKIIDTTNSFDEDKPREYVDICPTLRSERHGLAVQVLDFRIRKLTPKECFRLMGVKDEDINLVNSNTQSYRIAGNAIEVNTIRSIIRSLYKPKPKDTLF